MDIDIDFDEIFDIFNDFQDNEQNTFEDQNFDDDFSLYDCTKDIKDTNQNEINKTEKKHYTKKNIILSDRAKNFKLYYYLIFDKYTKITKPMIQKIHNKIKDILGLKPMSRDSQRVKDKYFEEFLEYSPQIILYLLNHKEILNNI